MPRVTALFLGEGTRRVTMEIAPWCGATIYCISVWRNFYSGEKKNHDSGSTVAWGSVAPLPLWSQNREHVVLMLRIQCQGGGILGDVG